MDLDGRDGAAKGEKKVRLSAAGLLPEVIRRFVSISEADDLLREILGLCRNALGADEVSLLLLDPAGRELVEHEVVGKRVRATKVRLRFREEGVVGWVAAHRLPQVVPDVRKDKRYVKVLRETRSEAAMPILAGDKLLGVLNFESRRLGYFQKEDLGLLAFLAAQLAIALRVVDLKEELRGFRDRMGALHNVARLVGGVVPSDVVFQRVADAVRRICGGHYTAIFRGDYEREELVLLAQSSARPLDTAVGMRIKFRTGLVGKAFELGETVNVRDVRRESLHPSKVSGVLSQLCVPIRVGDNCMGILDAEAQTAGEFAQDEVVFMETVARILAPLLQTPAAAR